MELLHRQHHNQHQAFIAPAGQAGHQQQLARPGTGCFSAATPTSRPHTPRTPRQQQLADDTEAPDRKQPAWLVADWKHRVPATPRVRHRPAVLTPPQQSARVAERQAQLAADFAGVHTTINHMLERCKQVQLLLAKRATGSTPAGARSSHTGSRSSRRPSSASGSGCHQLQPRAEAPTSLGPVDLNPGLDFQPGSPQRQLAVLQSSDTAGMPAAAASVAGPAPLTHRETLQAGIQVLTGELFAAIKQRQQEAWEAGMAGGAGFAPPPSWFGA